MKRYISTALAAVITGGLLSIAAPAQADRPMPGANEPTCTADGRTKARTIVIPEGRPDTTTRVKIRLTRKLDGETKIRHRVKLLSTAHAIRFRMRPGERVHVEVVKGGRTFMGGATVHKALRKCGR